MQNKYGLAKAIKLASMSMVMGVALLPFSASYAEDTMVTDEALAAEETMVSEEAMASEENSNVEEVFVTGSRIQRSSVDTLGPMTVLDSATIRNSGAITVEELLKDMPAISLNGTNANDANGGKGTSFAGIHNITESKTLVLVNGRRFVPTILGSDMAVDMKNIPTKMIDRVEVLADGASAVYGSDAVAGVINIILKKDMEEGILEIGGGITSEGDRQTTELSVAKGGNIGDKGTFVAGLSYSDRKAVKMPDRKWSTTPILWDLGGGTTLMGSGIPPEGTFSAFVPSTTDTNQYTQAQLDGFAALDEADANYYDGDTQSVGADAFVKGATTKYIFNADGDALEVYSTFDESKGHRFNYNTGEGDLEADLISPDTNLNTYFTANFDINATTTAFAELGLSKREGSYQMMGLPISGSHGKYTDMIPVPLTNSNIPAAALSVLNADTTIAADGQFEYTWRSQDLGQRFFTYEGQNINFVTGINGELAGWDWATYIGLGQSKLDETTANQVNVTNLRTAVDPALCAADSACTAAFADTGGSIDIFGRNTYTQAQKDYVLFDDSESAEYNQAQFGLSFSNDIAQLPAGALGFAGGFEYRDEDGSSTRSEVTENGDSGGNFAEPTKGGYTVTELFAEFNVPLLAGEPMAEELTLDTAIRFSDYSTFGSEGTYRLGLSWAPIEGLRFRGVGSTAYRAPNVMELFSGNSDSYNAVSDPCSDYATSTDAVLVANCTNAGVPSNYVQDAGQLRISQGGNPDLKPETANTSTFGVVFTAIEDFSVTVDYYNVVIEDAIGTPTESDVIGNCYNTPGLANAECSRITRNAQGKIVGFNLLNENLDEIKSEGIDMTMNYNFDLAAGNIAVNLLASKVIEYSETTVDGVTNDKTGKVFCSQCGDSMYPEFRSNLSVTYTQDNWGVTATHRYLPQMTVVALFESDDVQHGTKSDAMNYLDINGFYEAGDFTIIAGINNVSDLDPYSIPDVSNNTSDGYDWLGRYYYTKVQMSF